MALNNGKKDKIAKRRRIIADYRLRGVDDTWELMALLEKEHSIAVSERTVYYDKEAIEQQWLEASKEDNEKRKANLSQRYEYIHREALTAWFKSLEDAETTIQEMIEGVEGSTEANGKGRLKASTRKEGQSGNPALLAQAQGALKAIREMFGVDAAKAGESDDKPFIVKVVYGDRNQRANDTSTPTTPETDQSEGG